MGSIRPLLWSYPKRHISALINSLDSLIGVLYAKLAPQLTLTDSLPLEEPRHCLVSSTSNKSTSKVIVSGGSSTSSLRNKVLRLNQCNSLYLAKILSAGRSDSIDFALQTLAAINIRPIKTLSGSPTDN